MANNEASKKRVTRKQLLNEPDEFITLTSKVVQWSREHEKELYTAIVALSLVILLAAGWSFFSTRSERKASSLFSKAQQQYWARLSNTDPAEAALASSKSFEAVANEHPGARGGKLAAVLSAQTAYDNADYDGAVKWFEKAEAAFKHDPLVLSQVKLGLAYSYEAKGDYEKAAECFAQVLEIKNGVGREDASFGLARIYESMGEAEKSMDAYEKFAEDFPESAYRQMAMEKIKAGGA